MNNDEVVNFIGQLTAVPWPFLSILSYPHPFTAGGVILVVEDDCSDLLALIGEAHRLLPPEMSLHCVRRREMFQLSLPGIFAPPFVVNERPFLPHWLQHKGRLWWGKDMRHLVQPTVEPRRMLAGHLEGCRDSLRRYGILPALLRQKYANLLTLLEQEMVRVMGTAVLLHNRWDIDVTTLPSLFVHLFPEEKANPLWPQLQAQRSRLVAEPQAAAYHAVWLFETFIRRLEAYT
ncbi:MAG: hypothetical protein H6667_20840 [Ardenticatenaceae bacterium]|nr:hypothetical protein [Ardenticatenaceae bacterium]MCB9446456.1 hypothetical protein [Ardenticatenaceae bacterium]